jgi:hypothetical protein
VKPAGISRIKRGNFDELATKSKNKTIRDLYRGMNYFKMGYLPRSV